MEVTSEQRFEYGGGLEDLQGSEGWQSSRWVGTGSGQDMGYTVATVRLF